MGSCHRGGSTTTQRRPPPCRRSEAVAASLPANASLAPPAAGHHLPAVGYQRARHQTGAAESAGVVAARLLSSCRKAILGDWRLATVNVRTTSGVLSDWLRGRDPKLTREEFTARWCHRNVLCAVGEGLDAQLSIPWSAQHPVPLPA
ncbi:hypothetical protein COCOBI_03-4340 [Coccomyxa sp. Obi]|nr:hypothetical protein COCOBI_03-4340 [Coccomyxa sp. Obi]